MKKICPFFPPDEEGTKFNVTLKPVVCLQESCELWVEMFTTEGLRIRGCAFRFMAMKTSEGKVAV